MKTSPPSHNLRKRFRFLRSINGVGAQHKKTAALLAGSTFLAAGAYAQNTSETVANGLAANALLSSPATYGATGTTPTATTDIIFSNQTYTTTSYDGTNLTAGSINDLSPTALTITTGNTASVTSLTLSGGDLVSPNPGDLIYVATGGNLTINGGTSNKLAVVLGNSGNFDVAGTGSLTISAALSGANNLTKIGAGTLILSGTNAAGVTGNGTLAGFSGNVTISAGTLQVGAGGTTGDLGTGGTVTNNGALVFNRSDAALSVSQNITGSGTLTKSGAGLVTLQGSNDYTGGTAVNVGTLEVGFLASLPSSGTGTTVASGATLALTVGNNGNDSSTVDTLRTNATFASGASLGIDTAGDFTYTNNLTGAIGLNKLGPSTLMLTGTNTYTGATTITGGTLQAAGPVGALPTGSTVIFPGSTTLSIHNDAAGTIAQGNNITLTLNGGSPTIDASNNGGATTGSTVAFGALSFGTSASVVAGTINFTSSSGYLESFTSLALPGNSGGTPVLNPTTTSVTIGNVSNQQTSTGNNAYDTLTLSGTSTGNQITGTIANPTVAGGASFTALSKIGTSTWILSGASTYTGGTSIGAGTLQIGNGGTTGSLSLSSAISDNAALVFNRSNAVLQGADFTAAAITGTGTLTQAGTGTLTLTAANTYSGATIINAGGTLQIGGGATSGALSTSSAITDNGTLAFNRTDAVAQGTNFSAAAITGSGGLTQIGTGTTTLTAANTYGGTTAVNAGTLAITGNATAAGSISASSPLSLGGGTLNYAPTINAVAQTGLTQNFASTAVSVGNSALAVSAGNTLGLGAFSRPGTGFVNVNYGQTSGVVTASGTTLTNGIIGTYASYGGSGLGGFRYATVSGGNVVGYSGTGAASAATVSDTSGTGNFEIGGGGTGAAGDAFVAGTSINTLRTNFGTGGAVIGGDFTANGLMQGSLGTNTFTGNLTIGANRKLDILANTNAVVLSGVVSDNAAGASSVAFGGSLNASTSALTTLTLSGANTYTGGTTLNAGTVSLGSAGALGTTGAISMFGGTLQFSAANNTDYSSRLSTAAGQVYSFDTNGQNVTFATSFGGTNTRFAKTGAGSLTLSAANTVGAQGQIFNFGSGTTNAGTIVLANSTALGRYSTINEAATTTGTSVLALSGGNTYAYNLNTVGRTGIGLSAVSLLNISGNNTFNGNITFPAAGNTLIFENDSGTLTLTGALTLSVTSATKLLLTGAGSTVYTGNYNAGYLGINQYGTGTTTFTGASAGSSSTIVVNSGIFAVTGNATAAATIGSPGGYQLGGGMLRFAPTINGVAQTGLTLPTGNTTLNAGNSSVDITAGNTVTLGSVSRNAGSMLNLNPVGTGTATTTTTTLANGLFFGPAISTGSGTALSYTTRVATGTVAVTPYTAGTAAATAANVTDTTGTANYNVAAGGTVVGTSANTLRYTGAADTVAGPIALNGLMNAGTGILTMSGAVNAGSTNELVVTSNGQGITFNGAIGNNGGNASALTYGGPGAGILTMTATNTYTGTTYVNAGTLLNNGTIAGAVNVNPSGILGGTGTITGAVTVGQNAVITGGTVGTVGTLTLSGALTLNGISGASSNFLVDLNATGSDHLQISGALTLSVAAGAVETLTFNGTPTLATYNLANYASLTNAAQRFTVTNLPAGYALNYGPTELDLVAVPEPSTWAGGLLCVGLLGMTQRRRIGAWMKLARVS